ncbi:MAG: MoxR family ATPase [Sphingobacteriales bacterium]|nr:MAG: MoxR family ATPase [Sphingobacteriales bacterium]
MNLTATELIQRLIGQIETVVRGKRAQIELVLTALFAGGHVLLEDNPGTGKTVMARTLAQCISGNTTDGHAVFKRIQFTPDLLPLDLIGAHIFDDRTRDFVFRKGPIFCNILLADEINRASPKVQSALLEAMAESQITTGDQTYPLQQVFFTIATQNPVEMEGTYPLPAAQLDRFFIKLYFGYVDEATELDIYRSYAGIRQNLTDLQPVLTLQDVLSVQAEAETVFVHDEILRSVAHIVRNTRSHADITLGASTRAGIAFIRCLRAWALIKGRDFVNEADVTALARYVLDHRLAYRNRDGRAQALDSIVTDEGERLSKLKLA